MGRRSLPGDRQCHTCRVLVWPAPQASERQAFDRASPWVENLFVATGHFRRGNPTGAGSDSNVYLRNNAQRARLKIHLPGLRFNAPKIKTNKRRAPHVNCNCTKKVFISVDIEGITGMAHWDEASKDRADYNYFCEQMGRETLAAVEGAIAGGATEVFIKEAIRN